MLWEAQTQAAFELERDMSLNRATMATFGDLLHARKYPGRGGERVIEDWYSEMDGLGMLVMAATMAI
jgi:hypothetical protein